MRPNRLRMSKDHKADLDPQNQIKGLKRRVRKKQNQTTTNQLKGPHRMRRHYPEHRGSCEEKFCKLSWESNKALDAPNRRT